MMRRNNNKSQSGGYNNQHRRRHHSGGHSGGQQGGNRPRKNWPQLREKYLQQARDVLSSGDRVLAENYFQHAEHCYRMMVEEGYNPRQQQQAQEQRGDESAPQNSQESSDSERTVNPGLPAFITSTAFPSMDQEMAKEPVIVQNWEEN